MPDEFTLLDLIDDDTGELGRRLWSLNVEKIRHFRCGRWTADPDMQACQHLPARHPEKEDPMTSPILDPPRVICAWPGCETECVCNPRHASNLLDAGWRCGMHRGQSRPGEPPC